MKYYKIMTFENKIIGAVSSTDFVRYSPIANSYLRCDEKLGEYVIFNGITYRSAWMAPCKTDRVYTEVQVIEISKEEYQIFIDAMEHNEEIPEQGEDVPPPSEPVDEIEEETLEYIRSSKISEMSFACKKAIESGIDFNLRGETKHFSLTIQDQLNLMTINASMEENKLIPYHADGEIEAFYTPTEMKQLIDAVNTYKSYHITYFNALKNYINSLDTIEAIAAIIYGTEIPDAYKSEVLKVME